MQLEIAVEQMPQHNIPIFVDAHAEPTSEENPWTFPDAGFGGNRHSHPCQTADDRFCPRGTALSAMLECVARPVRFWAQRRYDCERFVFQHAALFQSRAGRSLMRRGVSIDEMSAARFASPSDELIPSAARAPPKKTEQVA